MGIDRLHPAVQHHIVNSLGWSSLRELQEAAIEPIINGADALIVGPTAGGKTEAAALPMLSRMLTEDWGGLSVLYMSPLRALANDIELRLQSLFGLTGRSVAAWHGDVGESQRKAILREPPDLLVTTPESLEVMLVSRKVEHTRLFRDVKAVVVDEVHSFGGDDRGWHLLAVLARIERLIDRRLQRIGLSATVGNPEELLRWLQMEGDGHGQVLRGGFAARREADLSCDFVGSLSNAGTVIAGLHQGEKRLVFCDSRADVERLASALRGLGTETYVSHSSLSRDERRQAEMAFADGRNCVIVATSTLELGIDVGDLDRVIQIDAPNSVASFLQRMGRTGRRERSTPNTLFLATAPEYLLRALGLCLLWSRNVVEPICAPERPLHIVGQQLLALCLQEGHLGRNTWYEWIDAAGLDRGGRHADVADFMLDRELLEVDQEMLFMGEHAEQTFGRKNFMDLLSVFTSPPLVEVRHGKQHLGSVHESSFIVRSDQTTPILLLAGRSWALEELDWRRRVAYVVPAKERGDSRWMGSGQALSFALCRAMREVLTGAAPPIALSKRGTSQLEALRQEFEWASTESTTLVSEGDRTRWWTFAGTLANYELAWRLGELAETSSGGDEFSIPVRRRTTPAELRAAVAQPPGGALPINANAVSELKFNECLPADLATETVRERVRDAEAVDRCAREPVAAWVDSST